MFSKQLSTRLHISKACFRPLWSRFPCWSTANQARHCSGGSRRCVVTPRPDWSDRRNYVKITLRAMNDITASLKCPSATVQLMSFKSGMSFHLTSDDMLSLGDRISELLCHDCLWMEAWPSWLLVRVIPWCCSERGRSDDKVAYKSKVSTPHRPRMGVGGLLR